MWLTEGSWWSLSKLIWPHSLCPFLFTLIPIFNNLFIFELFSFHLPSFLFFYFHLDLLVFLISFSPFPPPSLCGTQGSFPIYGQYGTSDVSYVLSVCDSVVYVKMEFDVFFFLLDCGLKKYCISIACVMCFSSVFHFQHCIENTDIYVSIRFWNDGYFAVLFCVLSFILQSANSTFPLCSVCGPTLVVNPCLDNKYARWRDNIYLNIFYILCNNA